MEESTCGGCGGDLEQTTQPSGWKIAPVKCYRCEALHTVRELYHKNHQDTKTGVSDVHLKVWMAENVPLPPGAKPIIRD